MSDMGTKVKEMPEAQTLGANDLLYMVSSDTDYKVKGSTVKDAVKPAVMTGATSIAPGSEGLVPAPSVGDNTKYFSGDGTYKQPALSEMSDDATHRVVTDAEKTSWSGKQDALEFDDEPTDNSNNPVKSNGIYDALAEKANTNDLAEVATSGSYNDLTDTPTITITPTLTSGMKVADFDINGTTGAILAPTDYDIGEAEGDIVTIEDAVGGVPLKSLKVAINPVQEGSGTPSPQNVRPIRGWTGAEIHVADGETPHVVDNVYNISWSEAGTVYGGTITVYADGSGEMDIDRETRVYNGTEAWSKASNTFDANQYFMLEIGDFGYVNASLSKNSNIYESKTITSNNTEVGFNVLNSNARNKAMLYVRPDNVSSMTSINDFTSILQTQNMKVCFGISNPVHYDFPAGTFPNITTLLGNNNIWSDTGEVEVEYYKEKAETTIEPNPEGEATDVLEKLGIDSTIYKFATQKAYGEITNVDIASFNDGADNEPLAKLEVGIEAVQSGSGEPSPSNVRPISGWSAVNVTRCGKNLIKLKDGTYSPVYREIKVVNGVMEYKVVDTIALTYLLNQDAINTFFDNPKLKKGTYTFRVDTDAAFTQPPTFKLMFDDGTSVNNGDSITLDTEKTITSIALQAQKSLGAGTYYVNIQVEEGSSLSPYEPYNGTDCTIQLGDTYYGGKLDVVSGVLTVDRVMVDMGDLNWEYYPNDSKNLFYAIINTQKNGVYNNSICSAYKAYPKNTNSIANAANILSNGEFTGFSNTAYAYGYVFLRNDDYTDASAFTTAMSGVQLVYELATPLTIQLTPTQVKSLLKDNNIWADSGKIVDLVYVRDLNTYLKSLDDRITALENA